MYLRDLIIFCVCVFRNYFYLSMTMRFYVVAILSVTAGIRSAVEQEALADTVLAITCYIFFTPLSSLFANFEL